MWPVIGAGISAGANLYAGSMAQQQQEAANATEARRYKQQAHYQRKMDRKNIELQKQFAQEGIRWKVADAEAAGIHPLYALGAQTSTFSPVSVGGPATGGQTPATGMANALAASGQDISRAIQATRTQSEREEAYMKSVRDLQLTNMGLQNELLGAQVAKMRADQVGPPMAALDAPIPSIPASKKKVLFPGNRKYWERNPWIAEAGDLEDAYGEEGPIARYGIPTVALGGDIVWNAMRLINWMARNSSTSAPPPLPWWQR